MMRACVLALAALLLSAPYLMAQENAPTKDTLYRDLEAEHQQYDKNVQAMQEELKTIVRTVKGILEPAGKTPGGLDVAPRSAEQEKVLADAQSRAAALVDKMLDEEMRHRQRVAELLQAGRAIMRAELVGLIAQGKVPTGTLRDLLMPAGGEARVPPPTEGQDNANAGKKKGLFDEKDDEDEGIQ